MAQRAAVGEQLAALTRRSRATVRDRLHRLRVGARLAGQAGLAAGLAWFVAHDLIGHDLPFFAPVAAVVTLAVSVGQRLRRAGELVVGVAVGIGTGDLLIAWISTGPAQIAVVVALAIAVAIFVGGGPALVVQSATSAALVATLTPPGSGLSQLRFVDALVGGAVGLGVMTVLLPTNPLTVVSRATAPVLDALAEALTGTAAALAGRDPVRAEAGLVRLALAETTPGPLIMVVQFVAFVGAYHHSGSLNPWLAGVLASLLTVWVTFVPCFVFVFLGAPYVERLRGNRGLSAALTGITAAVVGVIANLALYFAVHTIFASTRQVAWGTVRLDLPDPGTVRWVSVAVAVAAVGLVFRLRWSVLRTLGICAVLGLVGGLAGLPVG